MPKELRIFFTALMFYTRIPVPKSTGYSSENLNKATRYFPLIGIIVGGFGALVFMASNFMLPVGVSVVAAITLMIVLTGAFHEDAIADFCDGFGGGYGKEQILKIMKDSFIGTYGTLGLIILVLAKIFLIIEVEIKYIPLLFIAAHSLSRFNSVLLIFTAQYVREDALSKSKPIGEKNKITDLFIALFFAALPLIFIPYSYLPLILLVLGLVFFYFRYYVKRILGGYTGDVLGALQQFSEVSIYLSFLIMQQIHATYFN